MSIIKISETTGTSIDKFNNLPATEQNVLTLENEVIRIGMIGCNDFSVKGESWFLFLFEDHQFINIAI